MGKTRGYIRKTSQQLRFPEKHFSVAHERNSSEDSLFRIISRMLQKLFIRLRYVMDSRLCLSI